MKKNALVIAAVASALVAATQTARVEATVINVDINGWQTGAVVFVNSFTYTGQGALSDPGHNVWNGAGATGSVGANVFSVTNPLDSTGTAVTGVTVTANGNDNHAIGLSGVLTNPLNMFDDFVIANGTNAETFSITGLPTNTGYTLYLYGVNGAFGGTGNATGAAFAVTGGTAHSGLSSTSGAANDTSFVEGGNYVYFTGTTDGVGTVSGTYSSNTGGSGPFAGGVFDGLQISFGVTETPEPASLGLLGVGGLGLLFRRRREAR